MHRDLAARNVLLNERDELKIADFGMSRLLDESGYYLKHAAFPVRWTAPEGITEGMFSTKSDVWSYGILLIEIVSDGAKPYPELTKQQVRERVVEGMKHAMPENCPRGWYELMLQCWKMDASKRPSFRDIRSQIQNIEEAKPDLK